MKKELPPDVLSALEALEGASSPKELGGPYQKLLDWQRSHPSFAPNRELVGLLAFFVVVGLSILFVDRLQIEVTEFWRGMGLGFCLAILLVSISNVLSGRAVEDLPLTLQERIEAALNRWRHLTPLMRDIPK